MRQRTADAQRLLEIDAALREIAGDRALPRVAVTDSADSWVLPGGLGRGARLWVSRRTVDAGPVALRGELAHEYAHLVDPQHWRDMLSAFAGLVAFSLLAFGAWATAATRPADISIVDVLVLWAAGPLCVACGCWWFARISHRRELRADRVAAQLLGSVDPVLVMIERILAVHRQRPRLQRAFARLSHPHPEERRQALIALTLDEPADADGASR